MTPEQQAAFINAQATCILVKALGMVATNMQCKDAGRGVPYGEDDFNKIIDSSVIHHNACISLFHQHL